MATNRFTGNFGIGGNEVRVEGNEAVTEIQQNKTLIAQKLTTRTPVRPEAVTGLTNIDQVFEHFNPNVDVSFEDHNGLTIKENIDFKNVGDFTIKGLQNKSPFLGDLKDKSEQYEKMIKQLKTNKILKLALQDPEAKQSMVDALENLLAELENAE